MSGLPSRRSQGKSTAGLADSFRKRSSVVKVGGKVAAREVEALGKLRNLCQSRIRSLDFLHRSQTKLSPVSIEHTANRSMYMHRGYFQERVHAFRKTMSLNTCSPKTKDTHSIRSYEVPKSKL